ncbi:hypothetical protein [Priestia taiwanensis]|uniref:Uncharacterized protein n=1 Tax=Priestia taiwanensis TaxID=1347902 RepID=A0A917AZ29_9BACI|nr:hypothetical protein [Priestia taiwanensis]MBM7365060.1 hypothetical protein [Priestia taiwanensis]GGE83778.1 hypothetical protein GCM10007140_36600 [Priestia taiwanensis]
MLHTSILEDGLAIISSCKAQTGDIWKAHYGAACIGSYFFMKNNHDLNSELTELVFRQAKEMSNNVIERKRGQNNAHYDEGSAVRAILEALDNTIDQLHWVGHNVIYAAASLLAIRELEGWGSEEEIAGITDLIQSFERTIPGRSWIGFSASEVKRMTITDEDGFSPISNPEELSLLVLEELAQFQTIYRAESHHDLIGHMLTFSHALNSLYDLGHTSFFKRGLLPVLKIMKVLRSSKNIKQEDAIKLVSPVDQLPLQRAKRAAVLPSETEFWKKGYREKDWDYGHVFKFSDSFYDHLRRVEKVKEIYIENFRYVITQW